MTIRTLALSAACAILCGCNIVNSLVHDDQVVARVGGERLYLSELSDEDVIAVMSKEIKMRKDSIEEFKKGGREDLIAKTQAEIDVLMPYMPAQLSEDEVRELVKAVVAETGAATPKDMGKVMGALMPKVKGRADGKLVNTLVRSMLQG